MEGDIRTACTPQGATQIIITTMDRVVTITNLGGGYCELCTNILNQDRETLVKLKLSDRSLIMISDGINRFIDMSNALVNAESIDPNLKQVGGDHYVSMNVEPWEVIERAGLDFWDGNAVKYIMRHGSKNGIEDLKKAIHYIDKKISILEKENKSND